MFPDFRQPRNYVGLIALSLLVLIPLAVQSAFVYHLFVLICVYGALSTAWNIVGGYAGQLSLGHAVFYGIGSYAATLLVINFGISPWIGMIVGAAVAALVAALIAYPTFRLRGPFFALATIAVLEVVKLLVIHQSDWTGGAAGLSVPLNIGLEWMIFRDKWAYLSVAFGMLLLTLWVAWMIRHSRLGFYLVAVRERENAAPAVGIDTVRVKLAAALISAVLTSMVGSFHAMYLTFIEPSAAFSLELSIQIAMFALIGGLGSVTGPLAGTVLVVPIAELVRGWLGSFGSGMHGFIYGLILVVVVLTMPRGLVGQFGERVRRWVDRLPGYREPPVEPAPMPAASFDLLTKGGHLVSVGLFGGAAAWPLPLLAIKAVTIQGSYVGALPELHELVELVASRKLELIPVHTCSMNGLGSALRALEAGQVVGRMVMTP